MSRLVLVALALLIPAAANADTATYRLTVNNTWSEATHPGLFPVEAHFSWLGGGTHSDAVSFWEEGEVASPGMVQMAETGATYVLANEVESAITAGTGGSVLSWQWWFCPLDTTHPSCGPLEVEFEVDDAFPLVSLATMLGPSPDWFVGVSGLALHDGADWIDAVTVELYPYDGGTREANVFALFGPLTFPAEPIALITDATGQLIGPDSLGTFTFERLGVEFIRGDVNDDGSVNIADVVAALNGLFAGGAPPVCPSAADVNDDGELDISDPVSALSILFLGAPPAPEPYPGCGTDPTDDSLGCPVFDACP